MIKSRPIKIYLLTYSYPISISRSLCKLMISNELITQCTLTDNEQSIHAMKMFFNLNTIKTKIQDVKEKNTIR